MDMKQWIVESIFQSRTAWATGIALVIALATWIAVVPKDLAGWVALMGEVTVALGVWVGANKIQSGIDAK